MAGAPAPSSRPLTLRELVAANRGVFSIFILYSAALFACTFAAFFAVRSDSVVAHFNLTPNGRDIASAAAAVTASYLVIALYSCHAIAEADEGSNGSKKES